MKNYKGIFTFLIAGAGAFLLAPQFLSAENIELPEVTTIITGESEKADSDALPDFTDVLKLPAGSGDIEPLLPGTDASGTDEVAATKMPAPEKTVFAEGYIGGGYPTLFMGNISVYRSSGDSPFRFVFDHDSAIGYSNHSLTENYSDRTTKLEINKAYKKNGLAWNFGGVYKTCADGLQGNVLLNNQKVSYLNRDSYKADGAISYEFSNGFVTGAQADFDFYNRYAEKTVSIIPTIAYMEISPELFAKWHGYGFEAGVSAKYTYSDELSRTIAFTKGHRAEFGINLQWQNDYVRLYGKASAVIGTSIKDNPVIVPFTVGIDSAFPVSFSNRRFVILAEGGIKSERIGLNQYEDKYKFTEINKNTNETSDWYGKLSLSVPVLSYFTAKLSGEYRKTVYDNGVFEPDYNDSVFSIYNFKEKDHQLLITDFQLLFNYDNFSVSGGWHSNWLDQPALEYKQNVTLEIEYHNSDSRWGVNLSGQMGINDEIDIPVICAGGFVRITPSVRAQLSVNDIIKLYKGETRVYAGKYVSRGGSATLLVKFVF